MTARAAEGSAWSPLREAAFRSLWMAALASNVGTWMHDTAAAWFMTSLSPSPVLVALMQTAATLPFFLLSLPAGALADVVDRRRLLLVTQSWMLLAAAGLGVLTLAGRTTPWLLLGLTFALGVGAAMNGPAWQAIIPELVPRKELPAAVTLSGIAVNVARAIGPALGGLVVGAFGAGAAFLLNALSFVAVLAVLARWRRVSSPATLPAEHVLGAIRAGVRYVRHATSLQTVLARSAAFVLSASAVWALLPLLALHLGLGAVGYGLLYGCLGVGAVGAAAVLPALRRQVPIDRLLGVATLGFALASAVLALTPPPVVAGLVLLIGGVSWMAMMSSLSIAAMSTSPGWVRARALAVNLLVVQGEMAAGGLLWGTVAAHAGTRMALMVAAGGLLVSLALAPRFRLSRHEGLDLEPSAQWDTLVVADEPDRDQGPVLVTLEYRVKPDDAERFHAAMQALGRIRRRDGAFFWGVFHDVGDPWRWLEAFTVESWVEHLRQHERMTVSDRALQEVVLRFHVGDGGPVVSHLVAEDTPPRRRA